MSDLSLAAALGLEEPNGCDDAPGYNARDMLRTLRRLHADAERMSRTVAVPKELASNVSRLAGVVALDDVDERLLEFAVLLHSERLLDDTADVLGHLTTTKLFHVLSVLLGIEETLVKKALSAQGNLARSGLLTVDHGGCYQLRSKLNLLSDSFADRILLADTDPVALLRDVVFPSSPPVLALSDYVHVGPTLDVLLPYLRHALHARRKGVNILIYGAPGTGKSQLARVLARETGTDLFEIASEDSDGDPIGGMGRIRAYRAAQSFFANRKALLLFDEIEDVFDDGEGMFGRRSTAQTRKAWINRTLEENAVPTLWLSNSAGCLDPAFVRRFDIVAELAVPPKRQREQLTRQLCGDVLEPQVLRQLTQSDALAPAVIARALTVVRCVQEEIGQATLSKAVEQLVSNTLQAQGHGRLPRPDAAPLSDSYDPRFIRADADLVAMAKGICAHKSARLCLYGPPGTGKTAYARWLADQLQAPMLVKRASDLLSKYLGDTEKAMADAFREAEETGAVLVIDEVDSFLQDRRQAQRSWEVSAVNQMLTEMEAFSGVFVASTNLMDNLDQAALRRFDLKVRFDYLGPDQAWSLLTQLCAECKLDAPHALLRARMDRLRTLTPGDYAVLRRQARFHRFENVDALVGRLEQECAAKEVGTGTRIGFL